MGTGVNVENFFFIIIIYITTEVQQYNYGHGRNKKDYQGFSQSILVRNFDPHLGSLLISGNKTMKNLQRYFKAEVSQFLLNSHNYNVLY